jgi:hypothetical protein
MPAAQRLSHWRRRTKTSCARLSDWCRSAQARDRHEAITGRQLCAADNDQNQPKAEGDPADPARRTIAQIALAANRVIDISCLRDDAHHLTIRVLAAGGRRAPEC